MDGRTQAFRVYRYCLVIGSLDELLNSLDKCSQMVKNNIEGIVIKPYENVFVNSLGHPFFIKIKQKAFEELFTKRLNRVEC